MNNQAAQTMPALPEPEELLHSPMHGNVYGFTASQMHQYARQYAAALSQTAGVAEGWKLVPVEPTPQMLIPLVHRKWDQQWERGKRMQSEQLHRSTVEGNYGYQDWMIPPKTEYEQAAGQYIEMLERAPTPPEAPAASGGEDKCDPVCREDDGCPTEGAVLKRFWRSVNTDDTKQLMAFYGVADVPALIEQQVQHVQILQVKLKGLEPKRDQFPKSPREG